MAYYRPSDVEIVAGPQAWKDYTWGDKMLAFRRCSACGVTTHWVGIGPDPQDRMGVNARIFEPDLVEQQRIRRFDGADTWKFLDE